MRFDTPVTFVREGTKYSYETGNTNVVSVEQTTVLANVSDTTMYMQNLMYGKLRSGTYTIITRNAPQHAFDYVELENKKYTVDRVRTLRRTSTFFVSGGD